MPQRTSCNDDRSILVIELVRCDVNDKFWPRQPCVPLASTLAKMVVKGAAFLLSKICREQLRGLAAGAIREDTNWEPGHTGFRIVLHNCHKGLPEGGSKLAQVVYFKIHERYGDMMITAEPPVDVTRALMPNDPSSLTGPKTYDSRTQD
jgi:hypothetical protein